ncbi:MAG: acyltransferase [Chloroflexi bacterium]|nr:acyltransferase [Chloroflexota bacterium]
MAGGALVTDNENRHKVQAKYHLSSLTGIRAVAASLVFFYHWFFSYAASLPLIIRAPFEVGYVGVPIFFALSGFLITIRYRDDLRQRQISYRTYLTKRFIRIYPLYFVVLTAFVIALQKPVDMMPKSARAFIASYTLTQAFFPDLLLIGTSVGWTLTLEAIFYLLAPGLIKWLDRGNTWLNIVLRALVLGLAAIGLGLIVARLPLAEFVSNTLIGAPDTYILHHSIFGHLPNFLVGMVCGLFFLRRDLFPQLTRRPGALVWSSVVGMAVSIIILNVVNSELGSPLNHTLVFGVAFFSSLLILGLACDHTCPKPTFITRGLSSPVMVYLGVISYALYLIQLTEPCQWLYWILLGVVFGIENRIVQAILLYVIATALAAALYHLVERPLHRWLNKRLVKTKSQG